MNVQPQGVPQEGEALSKITGLIKWFDEGRGYGFMIPEDGREEVMVHLSCLKKYGFDAVGSGTLIECMAKQMRKGLQCIQILRVDTSTAVVTPPRKKTRTADIKNIGGWVAGRVKWFNREKGFGFVECHDVRGDIFLHMEVVHTCSIKDAPQAEEALWVRYGKGPNGFIATAVSVTPPQD